MKKQGLYNKLIEYGKNGNYGFHMPGHKRNARFLEGMDTFQIDITEITGFDNLHYAKGIIKEAMDNAANYFGVDKTWFLVNGSSGGILSAIHSVTDIGDNIVIGRNCHKSVYNAVAIRNLEVRYLHPEYIEEYGINGGYNPDKLEEILKKFNPKAVVITSPTYDGIVSDVKRLAEITHKYGAVLIVDEAHGAHFGISENVPKPAYSQGADLVIESVHKTLPALTQTALLHLCGKRVNAEKVEECLGMYQSSSPSYVLMSSIDKCIRQLQTNGTEMMEKLLITLEKFRKDVNCLNYIKIPEKELKGRAGVYDVDLTKLVIYVNPAVCDGKNLATILREKYHFEMEMESAEYVLGITTICDDEDEIIRLGKALKEIDEGFSRENNGKNFQAEKKINYRLLENEIKCSLYQAEKSESEPVPLENSIGRISGEFLYLYPPGIPLLVPGEVISKELLEQIEVLKRQRLNLNGLKDKKNRKIQVLK